MGGTKRPEGEGASLTSGGVGLWGAYRPRLSPATSATRSSVVVFKKSSLEKRLDEEEDKRWVSRRQDHGKAPGGARKGLKPAVPGAAGGFSWGVLWDI